MSLIENSCNREFVYSGNSEYEFKPSLVAQKLMESAYKSQNGAFMGFSIRFLAKEYYQSGFVEKALNLAKIAVNLYPADHPGRIHAVADIELFCSGGAQVS